MKINEFSWSMVTTLFSSILKLIYFSIFFWQNIYFEMKSSEFLKYKVWSIILQFMKCNMDLFSDTKVISCIRYEQSLYIFQ